MAPDLALRAGVGHPLGGGTLLVAFRAPMARGRRAGPWPRLERALVDQAGVSGTILVSGVLKRTVRRERPDRSDDLSFPSSHASMTAAVATAAAHNAREATIPRAGRWLIEGPEWGIATATAWARVEAGVHYPSDVLAGAALGGLISTTVEDAFFGEGGAPTVAVLPERRGFGLVVAWSF